MKLSRKRALFSSKRAIKCLEVPFSARPFADPQEAAMSLGAEAMNRWQDLLRVKDFLFFFLKKKKRLKIKQFLSKAFKNMFFNIEKLKIY